MDHKIALNKLQYYSTSRSPLCWFMNYLPNRYVEINNSISSRSIIISTGVPQGSIPGSLLFWFTRMTYPAHQTCFTVSFMLMIPFFVQSGTPFLCKIQTSMTHLIRNYYKHMCGLLSTNSLSQQNQIHCFPSLPKIYITNYPILKINNMKIEKVVNLNVYLNVWLLNYMDV